MKRWYESTDRLEDRAVAVSQQYTPDELAALEAQREGFDPEDRFTDLVKEHLSFDDVVVDIGTGTGGWLLREVSPHAGRVIGLDYSGRRLWLAAKQKNALGTDADFLFCDARRVPLRNNVATAVISRRGPWSAGEEYMQEGLRILAPAGLTFEITIGEQNGQELNEAFGDRAQMHAWRERNRVQEMKELYEVHGLELLAVENHVTAEVFPSSDALVYRLETSPSVAEFDPQRDASLVQQVVSEHGGGQGIRLTVHRICLVARSRR